MNKRIKELLLQVSPMVGDDDNRMSLPSLYTEQQIEEFAQSVVTECLNIIREDYHDSGDEWDSALVTVANNIVSRLE